MGGGSSQLNVKGGFSCFLVPGVVMVRQGRGGRGIMGL